MALEKAGKLLGNCDPVIPGVTDFGKIAVATVWQVAAAALAAANAVVSAHIAAKQFDLARRYYQIARNWQNWYNQAFVPLENEELDEVAAQERPKAYYDTAVGRTMVVARLALADQPRAALKCLSYHSAGLRAETVTKAAEALGSALARTASMGWRNERTRVALREDWRWGRLMIAAARGRSMSSQYSSYGQLAAGLYGQLADQAAQAAQGYMWYVGHARSRQDTRYWEGFKRPILAEDLFAGLFNRGARDAVRPAEAATPASGHQWVRDELAADNLVRGRLLYSNSSVSTRAPGR